MLQANTDSATACPWPSVNHAYLSISVLIVLVTV